MAEKGTPVSQDKVEYWLFPIVPFGINPKNEVSYLEEQLDTCIAHLSDVLVDYIWQNEAFGLRVVPSTGSVPGHLYGCTDYGDNVEDEWVIVFLLIHLTEQIPGLIAKVTDVTDGDILLIEAADNIPKWLNPETSDNRVFLYNGKVHIIPPPKSPSDIGIFPSEGVDRVEQGVSIIREHSGLTLASRKVQRDIHNRIAGYPEKCQEAHHIAHCYIPANLAALLDHSPHLVAPVVQAFYLRDPLDLQACMTFRTFQPGTRVMSAVRFSRCLYAQLSQQQFNPNKRSGYTMPPTDNPLYRPYELGMKLAHGAEILCSKCSSTAENGEVIPNGNTTGTKADVRWQRFLTSLREKGYFRGELEGSRKYCELEDSAKKYYFSSVASKTDHSSDNTPGNKILQVLREIKVDVEERKKKSSNLPPESDDSWLNVTPEQFEEMLKAAAEQGRGAGGDVEPEINLSNLADNMKKFVEKTSGYEGAEFPKTENARDSINCDPNGIISAMTKMFEFDDDEGSNSSDDMDEYGSDDDLEEPAFTPAPASKRGGGDGAGEVLGIQDYMEMMDRELAGSKVGQSFEKEPAPKAPPRRKKTQQKSPAKTSPSKDAASSSSSSSSSPTTADKPTRPPRPSKAPGKSPNAAKSAPRASAFDDEDIDDLDEDEFRPVNVDMNIVKNLLESYSSQEGMAGPASNILSTMGVHIPQNKD